ncbi:MAG: glycyl-tRNA synthetase, partial [Solirubrobacterales bacterium]|nr:glycyl-tRNA synthetase [Solirubrobacterales bacterium]
QAIVTLSNAPRRVARRSGVPIQHSAPAASIAAREASLRVVARTAWPSCTIAWASCRPRQPPATISIRATARHPMRHATTRGRAQEPPSLDYHPLPAMAEPPPTEPDVVTMEKIVALSKRRGFVFPSSEIYGGVGSTYDFGHYGVLLKTNVKNEWWRAMLQERDDIVAIDSAILQHPKVWEASGHLAGFTDPLVDCRTCGQRFRADHLAELACGRKPSKHPGETDECDLTEARDFNLMFETTIGPVKESGATAYLRPETAQGIFINFKNVLQFSRKKPPFGIAQVGKSFRNEITPGNFIFRTREFEQMEMEFFVPPAEAQQWFEHWLIERERWYVELGLRPDHLRLRAHDPDELSHYSSGTSDVEYLFPIGWSELEGIANRGDFDLTQHASASGEKLEYFDQATGERYVPHVIEPAAGADRATLAFLVDAYDEELVEREGTGEGEMRTVLRLHPRLAPVKAAVLPLVGKDGQPELAREVHRALRARVQSEYDAGGAIGRRYRRQDEIGTPFCLTIDHQSVEDGTLTLRDRDSLAQERLPIEGIAEEIERRVLAPWTTPKLTSV